MSMPQLPQRPILLELFPPEALTFLHQHTMPSS
jgi:hypothetical protein